MRTARLARSFVCSLLVFPATGCGGAQPASLEARPREPTLTSTASESSSSAPAGSAAPSVSATRDEAPPPAKPSAPVDDSDPNATRDVTYLLTPEGLKVTVAGVKFSVGASAAPLGTAWGLKLQVTAIAVDGKPHSLSSPKLGPLAFAGSVQRAGASEKEHFGDERQGDGEQTIFGDDVSKFSRSWPMKGMKPLSAGDALDLQVALWGLGADQETRRPVKQFVHVRLLVGSGKPRPVVEPPASASHK